MPNTENNEPKRTEAQNNALWSSIASIVNSVGTTVGTGLQYGSMFNPDARQAQVDIANANAAAAQAATEQPKQTFGVNNNWLIIGAVALVGMLLFMTLSKRKTA